MDALTGVAVARLLRVRTLLWLPVLRLNRLAVLRLARLAVLRGPGLAAAVHLTVLGGSAVLRCVTWLTELALVRRWALRSAALIRPHAAVPVPLLGRVLGVVVPTGWRAHWESLAYA